MKTNFLLEYIVFVDKIYFTILYLYILPCTFYIKFDLLKSG